MSLDRASSPELERSWKVPYGPADRFLEHALLFNFVVHGLALIGMALFLLPALPGGGAATDAERIATIAAHPWRFRAGWFPWQLCALADLLQAIAMVRAPFLPRWPARFVLALTVLAVLPDQYAQAIWVTRGVELAQREPAAYLALERELFPLTASVGAMLYTLAALGWTWCFARAGTWTRALTWLSSALWPTMLVAVAGPLLPERWRPSPAFVAAANGLGFLELQVWLALVTEAVLRRPRPFEPYGRLAVWRHHGGGITSRVFDAIANSRLFGALLEPLPELAMTSDIVDVVYVSYLVPAEAVAPFVPDGLELARLGPDGRYALFTFLTFQHGHFGFSILGPLRRWMPSPVQTNWRLHVRDPRTGLEGIYFLTNAIASAPQALAARMFTEGMPMHVLAEGNVARSPDGTVRVTLDPGEGSAPDASLTLKRAAPPALDGVWRECFPDWRSFLGYCVAQERAMSSQPLRRRISRQEIELGIRVDDCEPLEGEVSSRAARALSGAASPLCFRVPAVTFRFSVEAHDPIASA